MSSLTTTTIIKIRSYLSRPVMRRHPQVSLIGAIAGGIILGLMILSTIFLPLLGLPDPIKQDLSNTFAKPSWQHLLGTDQLGRDVFSRIIYGARYSLLLGAGAVLIGAVIGIPIGAISGFLRGKVDLIVQRIVDILLAFPSILLALLLVAALGPTPLNVAIAVGVGTIPSFVRLARGAAMQVGTLDYIEAARSLQVPTIVILFRHVIPAVIPVAIINATVLIGLAIMEVAGLGFLGVGIQAPTPEWGTMLSEARETIYQHPLQTAIPGIFIALSVLSFNFIGDWMRDRLDPNRSRRA